MDVVRLLPDNVANQIAAGEVIQRPASCLKELVENSLDAGATHIRIILRDAGCTYLQVIDNGCGMSATDARLAFERHATSKIKEAADLFQLHTMGFRGEALPSICAVAQVEMQTRRQDNELGTLLEIHGSEVVRQEVVQCPVGTNIKVKNLFFNVPARRRYLKTYPTELRNLLQDFYRIALVYPDTQFTLVSNDEILLDLPAGNTKQRIEAIFGKASKQTYTSNLVEIHSETELVNIHGYIGKPEDAGKNAKQYFFVNGRYMRHPYFHKALMSAYAGMLVGDAVPSYFIYFDINPENIDVNIHPTKTEIKFADEQLIYPILLATIREALGKFNLTPSLDFDVAGKPELPLISHADHPSFERPLTTHTGTYNPFHTAHTASPVKDWQNLYPAPEKHEPVAPTIPIPVSISDAKLLQLMERYILLPTSEGLLLVNQHRAHVCLLYDLCLKRLNDHDGEVQQLLFPDTWDVDKADQHLVESVKEDLRGLGFDFEILTPGCYSVSGIPAILNGQNAIPVLQHILDTLRETGLSMRDKWLTKVALAMAQSAAIPYGKTLTAIEMKQLLDDLFARKDYLRTPDGKPTMTLLSPDQLKHLFL